MFYSHEILSSSQYGVATIWLVATVGKSNQKKVTRKAIQDVNVPKACEKIIDPGAPLALRLQGNLLYGVSRVFSHQCHYVLSDAEKTQSDMMMFFRVLQTSETDPRAGKAKRHQITLEDDPSFDPLSVLPNLDLFSTDLDLCFLSSQASTQKASQMTPLTTTLSQRGSSSSGRDPALFGFDLPPSSHSAGSYRLPSNFGHDSPFPKLLNEQDPMAELNPFGQDDFNPMADIGLDFDADGNLIGIHDPEPELPPLPGTQAHNEQLIQEGNEIIGDNQVQNIGQLGDETALIMGEDALPETDPFPRTDTTKRANTTYTNISESSQSEQATAPAKKNRHRKLPLMLDQRDRLSTQEFRSWDSNYLENMDVARKRPRITTQAQARKNAMALLFDNGIAEVGLAFQFGGIVHPLAEDFSGKSLEARLHGKQPDDIEAGSRRGHRRSSAEAFPEEEQEEERHVKQKLDEDAELARALDDDLGQIILGDDTIPEMGMEAAPGMEDHHSSSMMPWSRPPSAIPGSSLRGHGSVQKNMPQPSPLLGRGSILQSIERHSDLPGPTYGSDDYAALHSQDSSMDFGGPIEPLDYTRGEDTQGSAVGLDLASQEFLGYATAQAQEKGDTRDRDRAKLHWIDFEELANPVIHTKGVAAEAFLHVLSLATKNAIAVEQDGIKDQVPFGTIRIGLTVPERSNGEDELA